MTSQIFLSLLEVLQIWNLHGSKMLKTKGHNRPSLQFLVRITLFGPQGKFFILFSYILFSEDVHNECSKRTKNMQGSLHAYTNMLSRIRCTQVGECGEGKKSWLIAYSAFDFDATNWKLISIRFRFEWQNSFYLFNPREPCCHLIVLSYPLYFQESVGWFVSSMKPLCPCKLIVSLSI